MPTGKRASMREGPLAALFRKTAEDTGAIPREPESGTSPRAPETSAAPGPQGAASQPSVTERQPKAKPAPAADPQPPAEPAASGTEQPRIPSPQERLRHAFSADIPENLMDRPAQRAAPTSAPEPDVYARS